MTSAAALRKLYDFVEDKHLTDEIHSAGTGGETWRSDEFRLLLTEVEVALAKDCTPDLVADLTACYKGLSSGQGSVPFIITLIRSVITRLGGTL